MINQNIVINNDKHKPTANISQQEALLRLGWTKQLPGSTPGSAWRYWSG